MAGRPKKPRNFNFKPKKLNSVTDKQTNCNIVQVESDVADDIDHGNISTPITESVHDNASTSSTCSQILNFQRKPVLEASSDPMLIPDEITHAHVNDVDISSKLPIGFKNTCYNLDGSIRCANVCFFNALIQILVSIPDYHNYIMQSDLDNAVVMNLKRLFSVINDSVNSVHTYPYAVSYTHLTLPTKA